MAAVDLPGLKHSSWGGERSSCCCNGVCLCHPLGLMRGPSKTAATREHQGLAWPGQQGITGESRGQP
ncbi:hypothetical protein Y1Q_0022126 [Alligator mississippiensis]|uniref:Uncharacterized protein n=1 Tax=Alligator mississippiensis TaxID=8496 RepID=A0A151PJ17_ALLMI|nr:hypothetical protein Y1Q_0022126 [Alligator mississippiensis]